MDVDKMDEDPNWVEHEDLLNVILPGSKSVLSMRRTMNWDKHLSMRSMLGHSSMHRRMPMNSKAMNFPVCLKLPPDERNYHQSLDKINSKTPKNNRQHRSEKKKKTSTNVWFKFETITETIRLRPLKSNGTRWRERWMWMGHVYRCCGHIASIIRIGGCCSNSGCSIEIRRRISSCGIAECRAGDRVRGGSGGWMRKMKFRLFEMIGRRGNHLDVYFIEIEWWWKKINNSLKCKPLMIISFRSVDWFHVFVILYVCTK